VRLLELLRTRVVLGDGAMGTELLRRGAAPNRNLSRLNVEHPGRVSQVHQDYVSAGAELLRTNTFMASPLRMGPELARETVRRGVRIAREAAGPGRFVAGSVGPLSDLPNPAPEKKSAYRVEIGELAQGGCDAILLETFTSTEDLFIALEAARSGFNLPIIAQMAFPRGPDAPALAALAGSGAEMLGVNCSSPWTAAVVSLELQKKGRGTPLSVFPSAGRAEEEEPGGPLGGAVRTGLYLAGRGIRMVGGCCGVGPEAIRALGEGLKRAAPNPGEGPRFPLSVLFDTGDEVRLESPENPETELEFFDSRRPGVLVLDDLGRPVDLRISECTWRECRLRPPEGIWEGGPR